MKRLLLAIFPGAESWLWRRVLSVTSVAGLLFSTVEAAHRGDAATARETIIGLLGALGIYNGAAVADDHSKRVTGDSAGAGGQP